MTGVTSQRSTVKTPQLRPQQLLSLLIGKYTVVSDRLYFMTLLSTIQNIN